jgi:transcriptional regulator with XRE-family HTH domain
MVTSYDTKGSPDEPASSTHSPPKCRKASVIGAVVNYDDLAAQLKKLRKQAGLSMKELALKLGYSYQWVDNIEGARRRPDIPDIERFAEACGQRVVFEIVPPGAMPTLLSEEERELVEATRGNADVARELFDAARDLSGEDRAGLIEAAGLLLRARPGARAAALSVLRNLQEVPADQVRTPRWEAVGDPDE